jgi:hypothetical protein
MFGFVAMDETGDLRGRIVAAASEAGVESIP